MMLTVYGCEPDEAAMFRRLGRELGVAPVLISSPPVLVQGVLPAPGTTSISVSHKTVLDAPMLRALAVAGVEQVITRSIGVDHIDPVAAAEAGIAVENAPYAPDGVADYTMLLILQALRGAPRRALTTRDRELRDLTVGVVGVGRIGAAVIRRLHGFGCRVLASDPGGRADALAEYVPLDELLRRSDVVTLHAPLTAENRHLIGRAQLAAMRDGAVLVNTARGGLVDTAALADELESGRLAAAALDVVDGDPADERRLRALAATIVTPHIAYFTEGALRDTVRRTLEKHLAFAACATAARPERALA
jgi:D-specific alpha-keto acid dehydrogenase